MMCEREYSKEKETNAEPIKIPLDFKRTVLAALETKPRPREKKKPAIDGGLE